MIMHFEAIGTWFLVLFGLVNAQLSAEKRAEIYSKCVSAQQYLSIGVDLSVLTGKLTLAVTNLPGDPDSILYQDFTLDEEALRNIAQFRRKAHNETKIIHNEVTHELRKRSRRSESWEEYMLQLPRRLSTFSGIQEVFAGCLNKMIELKIYLFSGAPQDPLAPPQICMPREEPSYHTEMANTFFTIFNETKTLIESQLEIDTSTTPWYCTLSFPPYYDLSATEFVYKALQNMDSKFPNLVRGFTTHVQTAMMGADIRPKARVLAISLGNWNGLQMDILKLKGEVGEGNIMQSSVVYRGRNILLNLASAMLKSAVFRVEKGGFYDDMIQSLQLDKDENKIVTELLSRALWTFQKNKDVQEIPLEFAFGKAKVAFKGVLLRSDFEAHEASSIAQMSTEITKLMTYPTNINDTNIDDYNKNEDLYGPLTEIDAVVIIADSMDLAKMAEEAAIMAGIQVPIYGARYPDDMVLRPRGAVLFSDQVRRKAIASHCENHVEKEDERNRHYCVNEGEIFRKEYWREQRLNF